MTETTRGNIVVLGSVHMDLIAEAARLPVLGESVTGGTFAMGPGGKGGNQACQLARLGLPTFILTRLGRDLFGDALVRSLESNGVDCSLLVRDADNATGASTILAADGDYLSIIAPGAAAALTEADVDAARPVLETAAALVLQLELPLPITVHAANVAKSCGAQVVLNASPAPDDPAVIPEELWRTVDLLIVNRVEAARFSGIDIAESEGALVAAQALREQHGIGTVIVTLGAEGAVAAGHRGTAVQTALPAKVIDTVGAGDAFLGAAVLAHVHGVPLAEMLAMGAAAGALAVEQRGATNSLPTLAAIRQRLAG